MPAHHKVDLDALIEDPLSRVMAPPRHEKPADRDARLEAERLAKKRSDLIDEDIERERQAERRGMKPVKILLLGAYATVLNLPVSSFANASRDRSERIRQVDDPEE
jgi:hypothetical protein